MLGEACALAAALTWAVSVILFKRSEAISPTGMNLFKNVVAVVLLALTLPILGIAPAWDRPAEEWGRLALSGILGIAVADTLFFTALRRLGPGLTAVVDCAYTPTVVLLSALWLSEPVGGGFLVGAALVVLGVGVTTLEPGVLAVPSRDRAGGLLAGLVGIVALALGVVLAKPALEGRALPEVSLVRLVAGVTGQILWVLATGRQAEALAPFRPSPVWRQLVPAAVLGTYVAMLLWLAGFKWANASVAAVLNQTSTVFTLVLAWLVLGERLSVQRAIGGGMALVGAVVVLVNR